MKRKGNNMDKINNSDSFNLTTPGEQDEKLSKPVVTIFTIIAAIAVIVNSIHLWILGKQKHLKKAENNNYKIFLIILCCMDLGVNIPRLIFSNTYFQLLLESHDWLCSISGAYVHFTYISQTNILLMVSIDRTYSLHNSVMKYKSVTFIRFYPQITGCIIFIFFITYSTLAVLFAEDGFSIKDMGSCNMGSTDMPWLGAPTVFVILIDLIAITILYGYIIFIFKLRKSQVNQTVGRRMTSMISAIRTIGCIIVASWACWLPPIMSSALWAFGIPSLPLEIAALLMVELNSLANPLIYGLTNSSYRTVFLKFFFDVIRRERQVSSVNDQETSQRPSAVQND